MRRIDEQTQTPRRVRRDDLPSGRIAIPVALPLEVRIHGRGGQGGVTCAKLIASLFADQGGFVQAFGEYGSERTGAPVRAYVRVGREVIKNRNRVYRPDHLLVLDRGLLTEETMEGVPEEGLVLLNTPESSGDRAACFDGLSLAMVDATAIAAAHGIGSSSRVIVNTTMVGAYCRAVGLPARSLEEVFTAAGLSAADLDAAREAFDAVSVRKGGSRRNGRGKGLGAPLAYETKESTAGLRVSFWAGAASGDDVVALTDHVRDRPTLLKTGTWRTRIARHSVRPSPCRIACPVGNDIPGFLHALREGGLPAAAQILGQTQPLPSVCGRVCPAPCQSACNREQLDGAVNVRGLERFIGDRLPEFQAAAPARDGSRRVAIVGGGPAGLGAAFSAATAGLRPTLFEAEPELGGLLRYGIPAYRLPKRALDQDLHRLRALGVTFEPGRAIDPATLEDLAADFDGVVVAVGRPVSRPLGCPGEDLPGVEPGLEFLRASARSDSIALEGHVVVVGGGNTAVDCARTALRRGASRVTLVYRKSRADMRALEEEIEQAAHEGVEFRYLQVPVGFSRGEGRISIELASTAPGPGGVEQSSANGLSAAAEILRCDRVFVAIGQTAAPGVLPRGWSIEAGRAWSDGRPLNVFVCGDYATGLGTVAHALGDGRRAALRLLEPGGGDREAAPAPEAGVVEPSDLNLTVARAISPTPDRVDLSRSGTLGFEEVNRGLADALEADRCFLCGRCTSCDSCVVFCPEGSVRRSEGAYDIDADQCKGCGVCAAECPGGVMRMVAESESRVGS